MSVSQPNLPGYSCDHELAEETNESYKGKKQRLLTYLRDHPEELQPAAP